MYTVTCFWFVALIVEISKYLIGTLYSNTKQLYLYYIENVSVQTVWNYLVQLSYTHF